MDIKNNISFTGMPKRCVDYFDFKPYGEFDKSEVLDLEDNIALPKPYDELVPKGMDLKELEHIKYGPVNSSQATLDYIQHKK